MPGTVLTVASGKGGVGKTTTTVNLGVAIWQEGNSVAIVDADLGMANLAAVLGLDPEVTLHDVLAGRSILEEALIEARGGDLLVLPGSRDLEGFAAANPQKLKDVLENLAARCDYVIVDTGAGLGYEDVLPLGLADAVILVSSADPASLGDTRKTAELAALVETPVLGVVVTRAVAGTDPEAIAAEIGADLLGTIPEDPAVMEATVAGDPLASHAPDADATAAYTTLGKSVLATEVPAPAAPDDEPPVPGLGFGDDEASPAEATTDEAPPDEAGDPGASAPPDERAALDDDTGAADGADLTADDGESEGAPVETTDGPDDEAETVAQAEPPAGGEPDDGAAVDSAADADEAAEAVDTPDATADADEADQEPEDAGEDESGGGGLRGWFGRLFS